MVHWQRRQPQQLSQSTDAVDGEQRKEMRQRQPLLPHSVWQEGEQRLVHLWLELVAAGDGGDGDGDGDLVVMQQTDAESNDSTG